MLNNFLFIGLPYIAIVLFFGGIIYRGFSGIMSGYRGTWDWGSRGDYYWTTRSTGFFGRASIGPAALTLHWGIIVLFFAHIIGLIGGAYALATWVDIFRWAGMGGGILLLFGIIWALVRRIIIPQVKAMSHTEDYLILVFLILITGFGLWQSVVQLAFGVAYAAGPWLGSILRLQPDALLMAGAPLINKLHIITALLFFSYLPFTKLVHFMSYPFGYITRSFISVRKYRAVKK
ncbi:MAG TPA: respiratory nitrate reductase subunit gamma [Bacteroidia bacterium]|nr:respiratory nitrate reductase subunit gamma [Bacteroidia bacterium]